MIIITRARATRCAASARAGLPDRIAGLIAHGDPVTPKSIVVAATKRASGSTACLRATSPNCRRSRLKALIEAGAVAIDGRTIRDPSHRVNSGEAIALDVPPPEPAKPAAEAIPLTSSYEDDDIIVIDKPRNLVVHPAAGHWTGTLVNALIAHCGDSLSGIGGERRPGIVHRLDKDTTGLMVVAKNDRAHRALAAQFADHGKATRRSSAAIWPSSGARRTGLTASSTGRSTVTRMPATAWRCAKAAARRHPLAGAGALCGQAGPRRQRQGRKAGKARGAGGEPPGLPAGNRPNPPDPGPFGLDRPSGPGRPGLWGGFRTKTALLPPEAQAALAALGRQALHAHILVVKHPSSGEILLSGRNCRPTLPVCVLPWPPLAETGVKLSGIDVSFARSVILHGSEGSRLRRAHVTPLHFHRSDSTVYVASAK